MPPATKQTPEERIAELKEQLSLSDQGVSKLAQRCLALEQQLAQMEKHESYDNMSLVRLTLYYDCGLGFSQQDILPAPVSAYSASNHTVSAIFELPRDVKALRLDPGELPCYVEGFTLSDERLQPVPANALALEENQYSGIVETDAGYHIILRRPIRQYVADQYLSDLISVAMDNAEMTYSDAYNTLDIRQFQIDYQTYTALHSAVRELTEAEDDDD